MLRKKTRTQLAWFFEKKMRQSIAFFSALRLACVLLLALGATHTLAAISVTGAKSVSTGSTAASTLTITPIAGAIRADLLVVQLTLDDITANIIKPAGWTELTAIAQSSTGIQQRIYWMIRSNTEPASYIWSFSKTVHAALILVDLSGVDTNQAINASDGLTGVGATLVAPEVAAAYQNGIVISFFGSTGTATNITPQASMTVPANGTSSAVSAGGVGVQLALAYQQVASDGLTGVRTATGTSGNYVGQTIAVTPAPSAICFMDNFNRASLGPDWASSNSKGGFNPTINTTASNQRLELTQNTGNQATLATLQRYFPAAGNNVVVSFKQYAYPSSSGADGIVTIFSDASVAPVAGGSGGSMGYAQYSSPANSPGFAGGWLGIGIDEFGNFSNPSENRYLGPGSKPNAIAIRGPSNSFYTSSPANTYARGYPYVAGTATLSPGLGSSTSAASGGGRGDVYRITIDSRVPNEQWVQVERSTDAGATFSAQVAYFNLMTALSSALGSGVTLPAIPANFWLSFTGGTGGSINFHEIDDLQVCATKMIASTPVIDHFRFENPGTMDTCQSKTVKVTACTDAAPGCTPFTGGDVYVTLKPSGWVGGDTVKLIGGTGTLQLSQSSTGTVALDIDKTKSIWPALKNPATYASECVSPGTATTTSCNLTVNASAAGFGITFPNLSSVACDDSGDIAIKACSSGYAGKSKNLQFWFDYTDPATTADTSRVVQLSKDAFATTVNLSMTSPASTTVPAVVPVTFDGTGTVKVRVKYVDVGQLTLRVRDAAATTVTGSNTFIVRPATFAITSIADMAGGTNPAAADATGAKFVAAGESFKVTVEARNNCTAPAAVKNFGKESTPEGVKFDQALVGGLGLSNNPALTTVTNFSFSNGAATATMSWPEVGMIQLTPRLKSGSYMGADDVVGASNGNVGRFFAHHLDTVVNTQGCSAFTYDRQPISKLTVTAMAKGGSVGLVNYKGANSAPKSFAKAVTLTDTTSKGVITVGGNVTVPALAFGSGTAVLNGADSTHPFATYAFNTIPTAVSTIAIAAVDTDNSGVAGTAGVATIRSGRLRLSSAYGAATADLRMAAQVQYWSGNSWVLGNDDTCTGPLLTAAGGASAVALTGYVGSSVTPLSASNLGAGHVAGFTANGGGQWWLTLSQPNPQASGSANVCIDLGVDPAAGVVCAATSLAMPWLQSRWSPGAGFNNDPRARATFGIFAPETRKTIHVRELF